jgi:hypothetical protein
MGNSEVGRRGVTSVGVRLLLLGAIRGEPGASDGQPGPDRVGRRGPGRQRLAGGRGLVRAVREADVCALRRRPPAARVRL